MDDPKTPPHPAPEGMRWARIDFGGGMWKLEKAPARKGQTPHTKLKAEARAALSLWKQRTGISAYYVPYFVGTVLVGDGRAKRKVPIGKKGVADSFVAVLGTVLAAEAKAGSDRASPDQIRFRDRWLKTGNPYVLYRSAAEFVDALDQIAAQRGKGPFG